MTSNNRICPCCGKHLRLIPPTKELLPERFGKSQNGVEFYLYSNPRLRSYTSCPQSNYNNGTNDFRLIGDLGNNAFYKRGSRKIVTVNNTANKLRRGDRYLFSSEMVFFCSNCNAKLALNFNPFAVWEKLPFQMSFVLYLILAAIPTFHPEIMPYMTNFMWYFIIAGICIFQLVITAIYSFTAYGKVIKYTSNFVPTNNIDGLIAPFSELRLSYGTVDKKYIRESNIFSVFLDGESFYLYLVKKNESLNFHICGVDRGQELMISLLKREIDDGKVVVLPLMFEGKFVGRAEVLEIFEPIKSVIQER